MNRIILIGNGFDLSHGMLTSYGHFLNDYWKNTIIEIQKSRHNTIFENDEIIIKQSPSKFVSGDTFNDLKEKMDEFKTEIRFKNKFLKIITLKSSLNSWVDVENEYYLLLKESYNDLNKKTFPYTISELNRDFNQIKYLLKEYLIRVEKDYDNILIHRNRRIKNIIGHKIYYPFKLKDFSEESLNKKVEIEYNIIKKDIDGIKQKLISFDDLSVERKNIINKLGEEDHLYKIRKLLVSEESINYFQLVPNQTLFLNFNYTFTNYIYKNPNGFDTFDFKKITKPQFIHIHGTTDEYDKNPIIFGFGDELDEDYRSIERLNNNEYLENIKSINYLDTDNYKNLLKFINSENYQIFIFGHSCGISDRTLLNTMFEHKNCGSIKIFYHQKDESTDNYKDIIQNLSRNFNDKTKMRDIVVNKSYSESLT